MDLNILLTMMVQKKASDLFITAGRAPSIKVDGRILQVSKAPLTMQQSRQYVMSVMSDVQQKEFESTRECNFAINAKGIGRFRVSAFDAAGCSGYGDASHRDPHPDHGRAQAAHCAAGSSSLQTWSGDLCRCHLVPVNRPHWRR